MKDINWFKESQGIILGAVFMTVLMVATSSTPFTINQKWKKEAVDRGFASWQVDAEGDATFRWNEPSDTTVQNIPKAVEVPAITASNEETSAMLLFPEPLLPKR